MAFIERMKARWGVGIWGVIAILTAFSLAGMTVVRLRKLILGAVLPPDAPAWLFWVSYAILIVPLYQVCLLSYGTLLGQFGFFWKKEKAMVRFLFGWTRHVFSVAFVGLVGLGAFGGLGGLGGPCGLLGSVGIGGLVGSAGLGAVLMATVGDAEAKVVQSTPTGFTIEKQVSLLVSPETAYDVMTGDISGWWDHST